MNESITNLFISSPWKRLNMEQFVYHFVLLDNRQKHPDGVPHRWIRTPYTQQHALFIAILCIYIPFLHVSSFIYRYFFAFSKLQLGCGLSDIIKVIFDLI